MVVAQLHVAKALYNKNMTLSVLHEPNTQSRHLQKACPTEAAELQKRSAVLVVEMLCGSGPKSVLKKKVTSDTRLSQRVIVDHTFQDTLLSLVLQHHGRWERVFDSMRSGFVASAYPCAVPLPTYKVLQEYLMHNVVYRPDVQTLHLRLLQQAQTHGEMEIVSHDATFKVLFSIIGQEPMAQREDEDRAGFTVSKNHWKKQKAGGPFGEPSGNRLGTTVWRPVSLETSDSSCRKVVGNRSCGPLRGGASFGGAGCTLASTPTPLVLNPPTSNHKTCIMFDFLVF